MTAGVAATSRLALPDVTLCCVDTRHPQLAVWALAHAQSRADVADAVLVTDPAHVDGLQGRDQLRVVPARIASIAEYSAFMHHGLAAHVHTSHALVVQWDGLIAHPESWDPSFLQWDYIGAPWPGVDPTRAVGNGGFSLRSRRLLQALLDPEIRPGHPEDVSICVTHRQRLEQHHGIRIAPLEVAQRFAYERTPPPGPTFGFHGAHNLHRELDAAELHDFLRDLPPGLTRTKEAVDLCRALIDAGRFDEAALVIDKRRRIGLHGSRTLRLALRLAWARMRRR